MSFSETLTPEILRRLLELLALDEERDVLRLEALVLGRPDLRELLLLRLVALLGPREQLVELVLGRSRCRRRPRPRRPGRRRCRRRRRTRGAERGRPRRARSAMRFMTGLSLIAEAVLGRRCGLFESERRSVRPDTKKAAAQAARRASTIASGSSSAASKRLDAERDLPLLGRVDRGRARLAERLDVGRAERERADGRAAAAVHEVVGAEPGELQLRLLDREQVLHRLGQRPVAVLGEGRRARAARPRPRRARCGDGGRS